MTKPLVLARVPALVLRSMPRNKALFRMHGEAERAVDADGLRQDRGRQAELRVAGGVEERLLAADFADHDVGACDVRSAALIEGEKRNLAGAERRARVDDAARLRLRFAREDRRDARQEDRAHTRDQAAAQEFAPVRRASVAAAAALVVDPLLEEAALVRDAAPIVVLEHVRHLVSGLVDRYRGAR